MLFERVCLENQSFYITSLPELRLVGPGIVELKGFGIHFES